ncbi:MAG: peptide-N4-asparagine amidase [Streptosporangiaceae bacterium]
MTWLPHGRRRIVIAAAIAVVAAALTPAAPALAGEGLSYQNPVTADMPIATPPTPSCTVTLAADYVTNTSTGAPQNYTGTFNPPAACPGPWAKVVLNWTGQEAGRQYDRAGGIMMGGAQIFFTSTPEPDPAGITWHASKDVTEYTSLFTAGQPFTIDVGNYVSSVDTGVMHIAASLTFYQADAQYPAPVTPSKVIGLGTQYTGGSGPMSFPLGSLPHNITRATLEVYPKGNACEEFWYAGAPNSFVAAHPSAGLCGGGPYREIDASLDGTPAGATIPFPNIFTGGVNPLIWRPIPAVDAFNLLPRHISLTPFAAQLDQPGPHTVTMSIANAVSYWSLTPNLLIYTDPGVSQVTGGLLTDTLSQPGSVSQTAQTGSQHINYTVTANRSYTVSGWVQTPAGKVTTTVRRSLAFTNTNVLTLQNYRQQTSSDQSIDTTTTVAGPSGTTSHQVNETDQLSAVEMFAQPPGTGFFVLPANVSLSKTVHVTDSANGATTFTSALSNTTSGAGVLSEFDSGQYRLANGTDQQVYSYTDSAGTCYYHKISAAQGQVTTDKLSLSC